MEYKDLLKKRRSYYDLTNESTLTDDELKDLLKFTLNTTPSAFNSQTTRLVLLLNEEHKKLWEIVRETLRKVVPAKAFENTDKKIDTFSAAYGSILFFEDRKVFEPLIEQKLPFADKLPDWSHHTSGIHQFVVWTLLIEAGMGASIQHYNSLIDDEVKETWGIDMDWILLAQMPFGIAKDVPEEKEKLSNDINLKIFE